MRSYLSDLDFPMFEWIEGADLVYIYDIYSQNLQFSS